MAAYSCETGCCATILRDGLTAARRGDFSKARLFLSMLEELRMLGAVTAARILSETIAREQGRPAASLRRAA
jgi:hypothetical protein